MLASLRLRLDATLRRAGRTAALGAVALVTMLVGMGFLTLAAWLVLAAVMSPVLAAFTLGAFYMGLSLLVLFVLMLGRRRVVVPPPHPVTTEAAVAEVIAAFITGVTAGRKARSAPL